MLPGSDDIQSFNLEAEWVDTGVDESAEQNFKADRDDVVVHIR